MAELQGFDANLVEPATGFEPIPAGKYVAVITESEMKPNSARTGHYLQLTFQITEGPYRNRYLWARFNLHHPQETVVRMARAELSALCRAVAVLTPKDSVELHHLPLVIHVTCRKRKDTDEMTNEIKGYSRKEASQALPGDTREHGTAPWKTKWRA